MTRVTGIGGIFFKAADPSALSDWYRVHLGLPMQDWGGAVFVQDAGASTIWNAFPADTDHFAPSAAPFMVNFRVADLAALLDALRSEGCNVVGDLQDSEYGKFGWVIDPEGNKVELWEPPADR
ncbi:MAG TPA: VOC family protein [Lysobacter sp.]|nr:VOC family protein [Lysobacter sp.]